MNQVSPTKPQKKSTKANSKIWQKIKKRQSISQKKFTKATSKIWQKIRKRQSIPQKKSTKANSKIWQKIRKRQSIPQKKSTKANSKIWQKIKKRQSINDQKCISKCKKNDKICIKTCFQEDMDFVKNVTWRVLWNPKKYKATNIYIKGLNDSIKIAQSEGCNDERINRLPQKGETVAVVWDRKCWMSGIVTKSF